MSFVCPKCSKKLASKQSLEKHLDKIVPCDRLCCGHVFASTKRYKNHRQQKHSDSNIEDNVELEKLRLQLQLKVKDVVIKDKDLFIS